MSRHWTRGRPELTIVANCRVKCTISFILTRRPILNVMSFGFSLTVTGISRCRRK